MTRLSTNTLCNISTTVSFMHFKFCLSKTNFYHTSLSYPLQEIFFILIKGSAQDQILGTNIPLPRSTFFLTSGNQSPNLTSASLMPLIFVPSCLSLLRVLVQKLFSPSLNVFHSLPNDIPTFFLLH